MVLVEKRSGHKVEYDVSKIKASIAFAVEGTGASQLELESKIDQFIKNGIKTSDIQKNIIQHAAQLATPHNPEWLSVAGRALAMDMWASFQHRDKTFLELVTYNTKRGHYDASLHSYYSDHDIEELGEYIDLKRDLAHSYSSLVTVKKKYLGKHELNQHMHMVNAMRFGQMEPEETRIQFVKDVYDILSLRKLSLATPFMSNMRKGGNVASCFILAVEDDLDSIFNNIHRSARVSKNGGGLGIYLGYLRAKGSSVNGSPNSAGTVVQWIKIFNDTAVAVNQGGKRAGAMTIALPIYHNDILDFLDMQTEHGDPRLKAYDVFPQVTVPDIFMERDREQGMWVTFCPFEVKNKLGIDLRGLYGNEFTDAYLKIEAAALEGKLSVFRIHENARDLTKAIMKTSFETGLPYIAFTDTMNEYNPNKNDAETYGIPCTNLCTESFSSIKPDEFGHVCNLASINLSNVLDMEDLAKTARLATRLLDHGISLTLNPDIITAQHNAAFRTIGVGLMGLHDHLAYHNMNYRNLDYISEISECVEYNCAVASVRLAREKGRYPKFEGSLWATGELCAKFKKEGCGKYNWDYLQSQIDVFGIRNSQLTSPAPTTTTSIYQDCAASFLPIFDAFFSDDNKNGSMIVSAKYLSKNPLGYGKNFAKHSAKEIIDVTCELQNFIDTGASMELIFDQNNENFSAKVLYDAIHYAHQKKIKAIYYIRTIKKNEKLEQKEADCVACSG